MKIRKFYSLNAITRQINKSKKPINNWKEKQINNLILKNMVFGGLTNE